MTSSEDDIITIQLEDSRDVQMHFEVERSGNLDAVFDKYSKFKGGPSPGSLQFSYKGKIINPSDGETSPASLGMSDATDNTIRVSLVGRALTEDAVVRACETGSVSAIDLLSENGELRTRSLTWFDSDGQELSTPPIFIAIDYGHAELVKRMMPLHRDIINKMKNEDDYSPLQWASWTGNLEIVRLLVEEGGAAVDEEALSTAREHDHGEVAEFLLGRVDLYAALGGDADAIMEKACREGDLATVRRLLEGEEVDVEKWKDEDGKCLAFSPIYLAFKNGHMDLMQLFAEKGLKVDLPEAADAAEEVILPVMPEEVELSELPEAAKKWLNQS